MKMQQQQRQQQLLQQQQHQQQGNRGGANGGEEFGRSKEERSRVKSPSQGDPLLSQQPKRWSSKSQIPHHDTIPDGAKDALGEVVERERVSVVFMSFPRFKDLSENLSKRSHIVAWFQETSS